MKKILFLSYNYPNGEFGASTLCSTRIMKALCQTGEYEVHCISYESHGVPKYDIIDGVICHNVSLKPRRKTAYDKLRQILSLPLYPITHLYYDFKHFLACKKICKTERFDMVVSQYYPEQNLISAVLLKKYGYIDNLLVIFWDNLYGKLPRRFIPKWWAIRRQRYAENQIAKYVDTLISLYPIKAFHDKYGDVDNAEGKRFYLGIPSVVPPKPPINTPYYDFIKEDKINVIFSGSIIIKDYIKHIVQVFNSSCYAENINLIFFSVGMTAEEFEALKIDFKGEIIHNGYIPVEELCSMYTKADILLSASGDSQSVRSKCFEYMTYGKPMVLVYGEDNDVNIQTFSIYPNSVSIDARKSVVENASIINQYIENNINRTVAFDVVEELFKKDSPKAYVELFTQRMSLKYKRDE